MVPMHVPSSSRLAVPALVAAGALLGISGLTGVAPARAAAPAARAEGVLQIVLDSSGSMAAADPSGGTRIEAARRALSTVVDSLPNNAVIGLRAYGGTFEDKARGCTDTRVVTPLGALDREAVKTSFASLKPAGYTPIAASLKAAVADVEGRRPARILLISDGEETCDGNPCEVARTLGDKGVELVVDTVGYAADVATRTQLQCIAEATGGQYTEAADGNALAAELTRSAARAFRDFTTSGKPVKGTSDAASAPLLTPGQYTDVLLDEQEKHYAVDLPPGVTPYVSATLAVPRGDYGKPTYEAVAVSLKTPKGQCEFERDPIDQGSGIIPVTTTAQMDPIAGGPTDDLYGCGSPGRYDIVLKRDGDTDVAEVPVELLVLLEPPVTDLASLPVQTVPLPPALPAGTPGSNARPAQGGGSFGDAAVLTPGTHTDAVRAGETTYYRVDVGWGQRLAVTTYARPTPAERDLALFSRLRMGFYNPARQAVDASGPEILDYLSEPVDSFSDDKNAIVHGYTAPITFRNRDATSTGEVVTASLAGEHYVAVSVGEFRRGSDVELLPVTIVVDVVGEVSGAPTYGRTGSAPISDQSAPPAATSPEPPGARSSTPNAADPSGGSTLRPVAYAGGGVVAALLAGLLLLLPWLRRRRAGGLD